MHVTKVLLQSWGLNKSWLLDNINVGAFFNIECFLLVNFLDDRLLDFSCHYCFLEVFMLDYWVDLFLDQLFLRFMYQLLVLLQNNSLFFLMDDWLMNFVDVFLMDYWLMYLMNNWLMMLMNNLFMLLNHDILVMLMNYILMLFFDDGSLHMCLDDWCIHVLSHLSA